MAASTPPYSKGDWRREELTFAMEAGLTVVTWVSRVTDSWTHSSVYTPPSGKQRLPSSLPGTRACLCPPAKQDVGSTRAPVLQV